VKVSAHTQINPKSGGKKDFSLLDLGHPSSALGHQSDQLSGIYTRGLLVVRALNSV
jgi:hypothetical protein